MATTGRTETGGETAGVLGDIRRYMPDGSGISDDVWGARHRRILLTLFAHVPFLLAVGLYDGTETFLTGAQIPATPTPIVLGELGLLVGVGLLAAWSRLPRRGQTVAAAVGMMISSTLLVQFSGGYIEAHFHFFVVMAILASYEDWLPFLVGLGYVAVGHGVFAMIDPSRVYNHAAAIQYPWAWSGIHAAFILGLIGALVANWRSLEQSREAADRRLAEIEVRDEEIQRAESARDEAASRRDEVERLNDHLKETADAYSAAMARAADGDLTVRLDPDTESEAMAQVARSFNEMIADTESTVREIQSFATAVSEASDETTAGAERARTTSVQIDDAVEQIAGGATEQHQTLREVTTEMNDLSATIQEVASSAETVARTAEETAEVAEAGEATAGDALDSAEAATDAIDATVETVDRLDETATEVGEIAEVIGDIADQTNLLALNANVEAARAGNGDGGTAGFTVVANEVKSLAAETSEAATEIETLIEETQTEVTATVDAVETARESVTDSAVAVRETAAAFEAVTENTEATEDGVAEISAATDSQAASTEEAVAMVDEAAAVADENADRAAEVVEATDEQVETVETVTDEATSLAVRADRLGDLLAAFEVSETQTTDDSRPAAPSAVGDGGRRE